MTFLRRHLFRYIGAAIAVAGASPIAYVQAEPVQTQRLIVPCAAGSPNDLMARIIARALSESSGQQVEVENITTGANNAGTDVTDSMLADGHTVLFKLSDCGDEDRTSQTTMTLK
jgi:tripartite-type tricarboxylate transporter receptor subunit TctC